MAYYIDLFSPETYQAFTNSGQIVSGFRERQKGVAGDVKPGDKLICYVTKLSRWVGVLEVKSNYFLDDTPIFTPEPDPFVVRFKVNCNVWLPLENGVPMDHKIIWNSLSFTKDLPPKSLGWTGMVRASMRKLNDQDGKYLEEVLMRQQKDLISYPISESLQRKLKSLTVKTKDNKQVTVSIPENDPESAVPLTQQRESVKIQALIADIGERMNMKIWIPRSDRHRVIEVWKSKNKNIEEYSPCILEQLPLNYDEATLKTIENIDILWIKGRSIIRAFEVEHTTSIYSGILRMADLMALQPNLNIRAHIIAPEERKEKVLEEISRPVFAFLESGPLAESCTFISYDAIRDLSKEKKLQYMNDKVLEEYEEYAERN